MPGTDDGLELARIFPDPSLNEGYFGIGDWTTAGATPDERLDVLDRTIRVRRLIPDYEDMSNTMNSVVVADANGRFHWRDITSLAPCTWGLSAINDVHTAWDGFACEPQGINNVGIGTEEPQAKLHVIDLVNNGFNPLEVAIWGQALALADRNVGVSGDALGGFESTGLLAFAANGERNWGTYSVAVGGESTVGVYGHADGSVSGNTNPIGVWGHTFAPSGAGWGGWFDGRGYLESGPWVLSDENYKTDVQPITDALNTVLQLAPKSFAMDTLGHPFLVPSNGTDHGFIAQELEGVIPSMVIVATRPTVYDSLGQVLEPSRTFKAVNYNALLPYLVGAVQEQQAQIQQLQQDLASCCTLDDTGLDMRSGEYDGFTNTTSLENDRLTIAPNPFQERTTLSYLLEAPARVRLKVHTESGMHLATLRDQPQEPGSYSMTWDSQDLAPGLYYVTLFADGKPVVRKAVKVR